MDTIGKIIDVIYYLRNAVLCLVFLVGIGAGVFLIIRKRTLAGILAMVAFVLFSIEPITDIVIFRILYKQDFSEAIFNFLDFIYPIISALAIFLGSILIIVALLSATRPKLEEKELSGDEVNI